MKAPLILVILLITLFACVAPLPTDGDPIDPSEADEQPGAQEPFMLALEAEDATIGSVFVTRSDADASAGRYLVQPMSIENTGEAMRTASITFSVPRNDEYSVWVRMYGPSPSEDAAYVGIGDDLRRVYAETHGTYEWVFIDTWSLGSGVHTIGFGHAEANARIDLIAIANNEPSMSELNALVKPVGADTPPTDEDEQSVPEPIPEPDREAFSLRGDPEFSEQRLSPEGRVWHRRLIAGFDSQNHDYTTRYAQSGNLYNLGRGLHTHIQSLLWAFRASGDLRILDEVDRLAQIMRSSLDDSWCAPSPDPNYKYSEPDGFVNWRHLSSDSTIHYCRDVHRLDESKTHGLVATLAYAYEVNRDLTSPGGIDYTERADFWADYLFNDYEKKWQARMNRDDALTRVEGYGSGHAQMSNAKMHYYLYRISNDEKYLERSVSLSEQVFEGLRVSPTDDGDAYVWAQRWRTSSEEEGFYLHPTTYARYVFADFAELHVEGVDPWKDVDMTRFSNTLTRYIMDDGSNSFARDVGGDIERAGIPPVPEDERSRFDANRYAISPYVMILPWDDTGRGAHITTEVYEKVEGSDQENPRKLYIPAGMVFYHEWRS